MTAALERWEIRAASDIVRDLPVTQAWDGLNAEGANLPFLDARAVGAALEIFGKGTEKLLIGLAGKQPVVMIIACPTGHFRWRTFQPSQIPLGAWVGKAGGDLSALAHAICTQALPYCGAFSFTQVDPLFLERPEDDSTSRTVDYIDTGWIDLSVSFDEYWSSRGKNLRQNMRKQRNKLQADGITGRMIRYLDPKEMAGLITRYGALESAGWKADSGTAIRADNAQGRFYAKLLTEAAAQGEASAYEYYFDDRLVTVDFCLCRSGTITILKTTYDESVHPYSPAFLLLQDVLEEMHREQKWTRVEFYGRMMEWHTRWTDKKRTLYHLTVYRWPWLKKLASLRKRRASDVVGDCSGGFPEPATSATTHR